jgi:hypothetical protein
VKETDDLNRHMIYRRVNAGEIKTYAETYPYILRGSLIEAPFPETYQYDMANCNEETFIPVIK